MWSKGEFAECLVEGHTILNEKELNLICKQIGIKTVSVSHLPLTSSIYLFIFVFSFFP